MREPASFDKAAAQARLARLGRDIVRLFAAHPREAGETYLEHLGFTLGISLRMLGCGAAMLVHGFFPFLFTRTGSTQTEILHSLMKNRTANQKPPKLDLVG